MNGNKERKVIITDVGLEAQKKGLPLYEDGGAGSRNYIDVYVEGAGHDHLMKDSMFGNPLSPKTLKRRVDRTTRLMKYGADVREGRRTGIIDKIKVLFKDS